MVRKTGTETRTYITLKVKIEEDDLATLCDWAEGNFRTAEGQASFLLHTAVEQKRGGRPNATRNSLADGVTP